MEQKNRGTYKVNMNITPKENVVALLKMTFPMDTTLAKMQGTLDAKQEDLPYYRRGNDNLNLNNVTAYPASRSRWSDCTEIKDFQRVVFSTKAPRNRVYNKRILRSVPVVNGKISLTKVTRLLTDFAELHKDYEKEAEAERIEQAKREEIRQAKSKRFEDLKHSVKLPQNVDLGYSGYRDEEDSKFDIYVQRISEEQVVVISKAIKEALAKYKADKGIEGIVEETE